MLEHEDSETCWEEEGDGEVFDGRANEGTGK